MGIGYCDGLAFPTWATSWLAATYATWSPRASFASERRGRALCCTTRIPTPQQTALVVLGPPARWGGSSRWLGWDQGGSALGRSTVVVVRQAPHNAQGMFCTKSLANSMSFLSLAALQFGGGL